METPKNVRAENVTPKQNKKNIKKQRSMSHRFHCGCRCDFIANLLMLQHNEKEASLETNPQNPKAQKPTHKIPKSSETKPTLKSPKAHQRPTKHKFTKSSETKPTHKIPKAPQKPTEHQSPKSSKKKPTQSR